MLRIRGILPDDIDHVIKADCDWHIHYDPDFDRAVCPKWCLSEQAILDVVRRVTDPDEGTLETRTYAVETVAKLKDGDEEEDVSWVCGGFAYELHEDMYGLLYCAIHPTADVPEIVQGVASFLKGKANKSGKRKEVRLWLRDHPHARIDELIPLWQRAGFSFRLEPDWFGDCDGWLGSYRADKKKVQKG